MIIQSSNVQLSAEHEKYESVEVRRSLAFESQASFGAEFSRVQNEIQADRLAFTETMFAGFFSQTSFQTSADTSLGSILVPDGGNGLEVINPAVQQGNELLRQQELTSRLLESLFAALDLLRSRFSAPANSTLTTPIPETAPATRPAVATVDAEQEAPLALRMRLQFRVTETIQEYERTDFSSTGVVKTADGREIDFDLDLAMQRDFNAEREYTSFKEVRFTDPLIVNFDGNSADLSNEKYEFDLDADGDKELISYLSSNSGMLAYDRNEDGTINDGTELFGALNGDGFADLAQYDEDGNNYIDEADSIFASLGIWSKTPEGESLTSLKDNGLGAIYLGSTETPFDIKGEDNQHNGRVRSSGIYLAEDGGVGTLQQIDMVV